MRNLLLSIQQELQNNSTLNYISDDNIYIVDIADYIPKTSKFPLVTIRMKDIRNDQKLLKKYNSLIDIEISIFQRALKVGDATINSKKGILKIEQDVIDILIDNHLEDSDIINAFPTEQNSGRNIQLNEKDIIVNRKIIFKYNKFLRWI